MIPAYDADSFDEDFWESLYQTEPELPVPTAVADVGDSIAWDPSTFSTGFWLGVYRRAERIRNLRVDELPLRPEEFVNIAEEPWKGVRLFLAGGGSSGFGLAPLFMLVHSFIAEHRHINHGNDANDAMALAAVGHRYVSHRFLSATGDPCVSQPAMCDFRVAPGHESLGRADLTGLLLEAVEASPGLARAPPPICT